MTIFENEKILVKETGHDYDFVATIENKTGEEIEITFTGEYEFSVEPIIVNDWVGIFGNDEGYETIEAFKSGNFIVSRF